MSTSENGWTEDFLCTEWFEKGFIPQATARNKTGKTVLLIFDGHSSHLTKTIHQLALANDIQLFCLPPHTTHRLQPLDVGVFGPLSRAYKRCCNEVFRETHIEIPIQDFVKEYMHARAEAFKPETIQTAFRKSGICPINPKVFTDDDYAPSIPTSSRAHVPISYPRAQIPQIQPATCASEMRSNKQDEDGNKLDSDSDSESDSDSDSTNSTDQDDNNRANNDNHMEMSSHPHIHTATSPGVMQPPSSSSSGPGVIDAELLPELPTQPIVSDSHRSSSPPIPPPCCLCFNCQNRHVAILERFERLEKRADLAETHCAIAVAYLDAEKRRANAQKVRTTSQAMPLKSRCVTSGEGLREFEAAIAAKEGKEKKKADAKAAREEAKVAKQAARDARGPTAEFSGVLTSKNKDDLTEIANALRLSIPSTSRNKGPSKHDLIDTIQHHLNTHAEQLKTNPRFCGLVLRGRRRPRHDNEANTTTGTSPITTVIAPPLPHNRSLLQPYLTQNYYTFPPNPTNDFSQAMSLHHTYNPSQPFNSNTTNPST